MGKPEDVEGASGTLSDVVYSNLRRKILVGAISAGQPLKFAGLRNDYDVSMGTLREALTRLVSERLVIANGRQGFAVAPLSVAEMHDIMWLRAELDALAVKEAIRNGDEAWEASIVAAFHRLSKVPIDQLGDSYESIERVEAIHSAFHNAVFAACNSPWLLHFRGMLDQQSLRYRRVRVKGLPARALREKFIQEHRDIMEAVLERDEEKATALLQAHIRLTEQALIAKFDAEETGTSGDSAPTSKSRRKAKILGAHIDDHPVRARSDGIYRQAPKSGVRFSR